MTHSIDVSGKESARVHHVCRDARRLSWSEFRAALQSDATLRSTLSDTLKAAHGDAFYWECRPWPMNDDPVFEFVVIPTSAMVKRRTDGAAFSAHFESGAGLVRTFASLRGDAELVVPAPTGGSTETFGHLASWIRNAASEQIDAIWIALASAIATWRSAGRGTLWVSTAGGGVPWLHLRLDSRPKYYKHQPYRRI